MEELTGSFRQRLAAIERMASGHRRLAGVILDAPDEAPFWGVEELAERSGTSVAAAVRFARKLGYGGFSDLKEALATETRNRHAREKRLLDAPRDAASMFIEVAKRDVANIEKTAQSVHEKLLNQVVECLAESRHRVILGQGISWLMAQHLAYLLTVTGLVSVAGSPAEFARQVVNLGKEDLLVAISFPPYSKETLISVDYARRQNITVVAFTDSLNSPLASRANHVFFVAGENLLFSYSLAAFTVLSHTIATALAARDPEAALKRLREAEGLSRPIVIED